MTCNKTPAQSGTTAPALAMSTSRMASSVCSKCGTTKVFGKLSCCAPGGSWFKNCGDADDTMIDHTWAEGVQACKSKLCEESEFSDLFCGENRLMNVAAFLAIFLS